MPRISPTPGSPITFSDILNKMGISAFNRSLDATEVLAMGGGGGSGPSRVSNPAAAFSLCMPYQIEASKSLGTPVKYYGPDADWTSTAATNWRPARFSEFRNAYNSKPNVSGSCGGTGDASTCNISIVASNSNAYSGSSTPYYFFITGSGSFSGQGVWVAANNGGGDQYSATASGVSGGSSSWVVRVCDYEGCGSKNEFKSSFSY